MEKQRAEHIAFEMVLSRYRETVASGEYDLTMPKFWREALKGHMLGWCRPADVSHEEWLDFLRYLIHHKEREGVDEHLPSPQETVPIKPNGT